MKTKKILTTCLLTISAIMFAFTQTTSAVEAGDLQIFNYDGVPQTYKGIYMDNFPKTYVQADIFCYGIYVDGGNWGGVKLSDLLTLAGVDISKIGSVEFAASDGYKVTLDTKTALRDDVIVAYEKDSMQLTEMYRLVYPGENGALWISRILTIAVSQSIIDFSQTGTGSFPPPADKSPPTYQTITSTPQPTPSPTKINQPTPTPVPTNTSITKPVAPPTNTPQPSTYTNIAAENFAFPLEIIYVAAAVVAVTVVASFLVIRRRVHEV